MCSESCALLIVACVLHQAVGVSKGKIFIINPKSEITSQLGALAFCLHSFAFRTLLSVVSEPRLRAEQIRVLRGAMHRASRIFSIF
jgi:hypothetical protein